MGTDVAGVVVAAAEVGCVETAALAVVGDGPPAQPATPAATSKSVTAAARDKARAVLLRRVANDTGIGRNETARPP